MLCVYIVHVAPGLRPWSRRGGPTPIPRQIHTRDLLNFTLRHQRRATFYERQVAGDIWQSYLHWRRARAKVAA